MTHVIHFHWWHFSSTISFPIPTTISRYLHRSTNFQWTLPFLYNFLHRPWHCDVTMTSCVIIAIVTLHYRLYNVHQPIYTARININGGSNHSATTRQWCRFGHSWHPMSWHYHYVDHSHTMSPTIIYATHFSTLYTIDVNGPRMTDVPLEVSLRIPHAHHMHTTMSSKPRTISRSPGGMSCSDTSPRHQSGWLHSTITLYSLHKSDVMPQETMMLWHMMSWHNHGYNLDAITCIAVRSHTS